jgi:hypothetical protein
MLARALAMSMMDDVQPTLSQEEIDRRLAEQLQHTEYQQ